MNDEDLEYIYNEILFSYEKKGNTAICDNMDEFRGDYAKWNKTDRKRQRLYGDQFYVESKKKSQLMEKIYKSDCLGARVNKGRLAKRSKNFQS